MLRFVAVAVAGACAALAAGQQLRFFWSETGLVSNQALQTQHNFIADWDSTPVTPITQTTTAAPPGKRLYLWIEFLDHPDVVPNITRIYGLTTQLTSNSASYTSNPLYLHRFESDEELYTRWETSQPVNLYNAVATAASTDGIRCRSVDTLVPGVDIFDLGTGRRFLLGSVLVVDAADGATLTAAAGTLGVRLKKGGAFINATTTPATVTFTGEQFGACCPWDNYGSCYIGPSSCSMGHSWLGPGSTCANCAPAGCKGDLDCDGSVSFFDIDYLVEALNFPGGSGWPHSCPWLNGDVDTDGNVDFFDLDPFVAALGTTCP